ncbi:MAG: phosphoenolpyruvate--protein phosphotransferase [candidate division KSB1 bacterium]|nr:phosphoenolpyruvate--protein phosphotransferase [candidate division KSB1 bacterium]
MTGKKSPKRMMRLRGIAAAPGIVIGKAFLLTGDVVKVEERQIPPDAVNAEIKKFHRAIELTQKELAEIQAQARQRMGKEGARIFDAHQLLLNDQVINEETIHKIQYEYKNADFAYYQVLQKFQESLEEVDNEYFVGRLADIKDVKRRLIRNIQGKEPRYLNGINTPAVIVAPDLTPSDTVLLDRNKVLAFVTDLGGKTSHAAIMARSLEIPSVVGLKEVSSLVQTGDSIIVDGNRGLAIINPTSVELQKYIRLRDEYHEVTKELSRMRDLPSRTLDGKDIELSANLEFAAEISSIITYGARGIGLFRTENLYLTRSEMPDEEEEFEEYYKVAEKVSPYPVIIRTLDIGGDKNPRCLQIPQEDNPFLGWRAIRLCLERIDLFKRQLRAILRASVIGNIKILLPMISCLEEIYQAKAVLEEVKSDLKNQRISFDDTIELGAMIEVPSAAIMAKEIAEEVDFLSIGTNDLIQYTLAVDRGNARVAHLYKRLPPAVLRLVKDIVDAGHEKGVWVGMCGEMAADPLATLILVGLDLDELSVSPAMLPEIKKIIRSTTFEEAQKIALKAIDKKTSEQVETYMRNVMASRLKQKII